MSDILNRKFETPEALLAYLKEANDEQNAIKEAKKRRPLQKDDRMFRKTAVIDGKAFWSSVVVRADGSIEVWMKRYRDDDDAPIQETTHVGFELISHLLPHTED